IAYRAKRNGNTPPARDRQPHISENSTKSPGTTATPTTKHTQSGQRSRMHGAFTTWKATSRNGSRTCIRRTTTPTVRKMTRLVHKVVEDVAGAEDAAAGRRRIHAPIPSAGSVDVAVDRAAFEAAPADRAVACP